MTDITQLKDTKPSQGLEVSAKKRNKWNLAKFDLRKNLKIEEKGEEKDEEI